MLTRLVRTEPPIRSAVRAHSHDSGRPITFHPPFHPRFWLFTGLLAAFLVSTGCGTQKDPAQSNVAVKQAALDITSSCDASTISWPSQASTTSVCAGAWRYNKYTLPCWKYAQNAACPGAVTTANTCTKYECPGVAGQTTQTVTETLHSSGSHRECSCPGANVLAQPGGHIGAAVGGPIPTMCIGGGYPTCHTVYDYSVICDALAAADVQKVPDTTHYLKAGTKVVSVTTAYDYSEASEICTTVLSYYQPATCTLDPPCGTTTTLASCRTEGNGADVPGACGTDSAPSYSVPGLTRDALSSQVGTALAPSPAPTCLTCDPLPIGTDSEVQAKYACLTSQRANLPNLPADVDKVALDAQLVSRLKLLFELEGSSLSSAQQQATLDLYRSAPASAVACGNPWTPPAVAPTCAVAQINADLTLCQELRLSHVSAETATSQAAFARCIDAVSSIASLDPTQCAQSSYQASYLDAAAALTSKTMRVADAPVGSPAQLTEIDQKLRNIQRWYSGLRAYAYPAGPPPAALLSSASGVLKDFWAGVYLNQFNGVAPVDATTAELVRSTLFSSGFVADRQVLLAAYGAAGSAPPLTSAPLLMLTGDALTGLVDRSKVLNSYSDMACLFMNCAGTSTQLSRFWNVVGNIHDAAQLSTALSATPQGVLGDWAPVFQQIQTGHAALESAMQDASGTTGYSGPQMLAAPVDAVAPAARGLLAQIQAGAAYERAFASTGRFSSGAETFLRVGLDAARQGAIATQTTAAINRLDQSIQNYTTNKLTLVQSLVQQVQTQTTAASTQDRIQQLSDQLNQISSDLQGVRESAAVDSARFGDFVRSAAALLPDIAGSGDLVARSTKVVSVSAADVGPGSTATRPDTAIQSLAITAPVLAGWSANSGDVIQIQTTGQWAPICALSKATGPDNGLVRVNDSAGSPIVTGPEGYMVQQVNSTYQASSVQTVTTDGTYKNRSLSVDACAGFHISLFGVVSIGGAEVCAKTDWGSNWSKNQVNTDGSGAENRTNASFARGLRSPLAAFVDQPVGSLLLVFVPKGGALLSDVKSVTVVQAGSSGAVVPTSTNSSDPRYDVYLVVNDFFGTPISPCPTPSSQALTVTIQHLVPAAQAGQEIMKAMAAALDTVKAESAPIVAQGRLLSSQQAQLRLDAYAGLYASCSGLPGCSNLTRYPESIRNLFDAYVNKLIVDVEREVALVELERQYRQLLLSARQLNDEAQGAANQSRLIALLPAWALRNLDGTRLGSDLAAVTDVVTNWIAPTIHFKNPETPNYYFSNQDWTLLSNLANVGPNQSLDAVAQLANNAAGMLQARLATARTQAPNQTTQTVVVSYPRPGGFKSSPYLAVDAASAAAVWSDIIAGKNIELQVQPRFLYRAGGGPYVLNCSESAPTIDSMALVWWAPSSLTEYPAYQIPATFTAEMAFPTRTSVEQVEFVNPSYLAPTLNVVTVNGNTQATFAGSLDAMLAQGQTAAGLSPFATLSVNLSAFRDAMGAPAGPLLEADELLVAYRLEPRNEGPGAVLPGVAGCE